MSILNSSQFGGISEERIDIVRAVSDEVHDRVHAEDPGLTHWTECMGNCGEVSYRLAEDLGWEVEEGYYDGPSVRADTDHYWNRDPATGTIIDATFGQFTGDQEVNVVPHWFHQQQDYVSAVSGKRPWGPGHPTWDATKEQRR